MRTAAGAILDGEELVPRDLWEDLEILLPPPKRLSLRNPGRKKSDAGRALLGILNVLATGIPWSALPRRFGCGTGNTCRTRLREWQEQGIRVMIRMTIENRRQGPVRFDFRRAEVRRTHREADRPAAQETRRVAV